MVSQWNCTSYCKDTVVLAGVLKVVVQCHPLLNYSSVEVELCLKSLNPNVLM